MSEESKRLIEHIKRSNLYFRIVNDLQLHLEDRVRTEGPPNVVDFARQFFINAARKDISTIKPFENEFGEWYYGQNPKPWCDDLPPHYHTKQGLVPRRTESVLPNEDEIARAKWRYMEDNHYKRPPGMTERLVGGVFDDDGGSFIWQRHAQPKNKDVE
jgi:hypothetical protein